MVIRVNIGGKLDVVCFDKTGTLTEDGLDVLGVHSVTSYPHNFTQLFTGAKELLETKGSTGSEQTLSTSLFNAMATCHSLRLVDDELIGDPLDLKMFEFTDWAFEEGEGGGEDTDGGPSSGLSPSIVRPRVKSSSNPVIIPYVSQARPY